MSVAPSSSGTSLTYNSNTNESSIKAGQILWNTTKQEAVKVVAVNTGANVVTISATAQAWNITDTITNRIYVRDGIFQVALNSLNQNWGTTDFSTDNLHVGINFNNDGEMKPRSSFNSVAYAFRAESAGSVDGLSVASGKTLTVNNTITFGGTDGTSFTLPSTSDTLVGLTAEQTLINKTITTSGLLTATNGFTLSGGGLSLPANSVTDAMVSNALTSSIFIGSGSTTNAVDLATVEVVGILGIANGGTNSIATPTDGSIAYGDGTGLAYTAVGTTGQCLTSDGTNAPVWGECEEEVGAEWTAQSTNDPYIWEAITYGNGQFVAVKVNDVWTSSDGISWVNQDFSLSDQGSYNSIAYGNGLFVVVGSNGDMMRSSDGVHWTTMGAPEAIAWQSVAFGGGIFVAVAQFGSDNRIMRSSDGVNWTTMSAPDIAAQWNEVIYGNGQFVAVANHVAGSKVMTSPDGITWTSQTAVASTTDWQSVAYGNGIYVAVGYNNAVQVMTSPDGITWTSRTAAADDRWKSVVYGNGTFVAVSGPTNENGQVMTSPDGITWMAQQTIVDPNIDTIAYANGVFVIGGRKLTTSGSPIQITTPHNNSYQGGMTINGGLVSSSGLTILNLTNDGGLLYANASGVVSQTTAGSLGQCLQSAGGGSPTWAGCEAGITADSLNFTDFSDSLSLDASTDIAIETGLALTTSGLGGVAFNHTGGTSFAGDVTLSGLAGGNFIFADGTGKLSDSGIPSSMFQSGVTTTPPINDGGFISVAYGNGTYVAVAVSGTTRIISSTDGQVWHRRTAPEPNSWRSVTYGNGMFVAVAYDGTNRVMTSPDGITWTARSAAEQNMWRSVTYGGGQFVAVAQDGTNRVMTSPDGITWTARTAAEQNDWRSVTHGNGTYVATAISGTNQVMTSTDGITWTPQAAVAGTNNYWISVTYGNGLFVSVATNGTERIMTSPDGVTWTARTSPAPTSLWYSVAYGNSTFVAVAYSNGNFPVMTSSDGITWTIQEAPNQSYGITFGNGLFVAATDKGSDRIMTSADGADWDASSSHYVAAGDGITVQGAGAMQFNQSGGTSFLESVGIGTNTPTAKLDVVNSPLQVVGSNLVTNGTFDADASGWTLGDCVAWGSGQVTGTYSSCSDVFMSTPISVEEGKTYELTLDVTVTGDDFYWSVPGTNENTTSGHVVERFTANATGIQSLYLSLYNWNDGGSFTVDNITVFEVSGGLAQPLKLTDYDGSGLLVLGGANDNDNVGVGRDVLSALTSAGARNTALGSFALSQMTSGTDNTAIGYNGLAINTTGRYNVAVGGLSLSKNVSGSSNVAVGYKALSESTGSSNTAVGYEALANNTNGALNVAFGYRALASNTTGDYNVAFGYNALYSNQGSLNNIAIGRYALYDHVSGNANIAIGSDALENNVDGAFNIAVGYDALLNHTTGDGNISIGYISSIGLTTGVNNTVVGRWAMPNNTTGSYNVALGNAALTQLNPSGSITAYAANGGATTVTSNSHGLSNGMSVEISGTTNYDGIYTVSNVTTNTFDIATAFVADDATGTWDASATQGRYNVGLGVSAGQNNKLGEKNVFIGYMAGGNELGSNMLYIANSNTSTPLIKGDFAAAALTFNSSVEIMNGLNISGGSITLPSGSVAAAAITADSLNFTEFADEMILDASTSVALGANTLSTTGTGGLTFSHTGNTTFAGKVGIGTTSPLVKLEVVGSGTFGNAFVPGATESENIINILSGENSSGATNGIAFYETTTGFGMKLGYDGTGTGDDNALRFYNDSDDSVFTIENGGYIGIGTTNPNALLAIQGADTPAFGSELVTNGDLTSTTGWTLGAGWSHDAVDGEADHATGNTATLSPTATITANTLYRLQFTIKNRTAGTVTVTVAGEEDVARSGNTTYTFDFRSVNTNLIVITPSSSFDGSIDDVTLKAINGTLPLVQFNSNLGRASLQIRSGGHNLNNSILGLNAGIALTTGTKNTVLGATAFMDNTTGSDNIAIGFESLFRNTSGIDNTAVGQGALRLNDTGESNTALGEEALESNTTGDENIAIGRDAMNDNTLGDNNVAVGNASLYYNQQGHNNTVVGFEAAQGVTLNSIIGNSVLGYRAGLLLSAGADYNTLLGFQAGNSITTGARNIIIGYDVDVVNATDSDKLNIGNTIYGDLALDNIGIGIATPLTKLHIESTSSIDSTGLGYYTDFLLEDTETALQIAGADNQNHSVDFIMSSGNDKHWIFSHRGPDSGNRLSIGYQTSVDAQEDLDTITEYFTMSTSGNIGIGDITPDFKLDVEGTLGATGAVTISNYTVNGGLLYTNASGVVAQTTAGTLGQCLQSAGGGSATWGACGGSIAADSLDFTEFADTLTLDVPTAINIGANTLTFGGTAGIAFDQTGDTTFAGNVGIGTADPQALLQVGGSIRYSDDFETSFGNWTNASTGDVFDWTRQNTPTTSADTGPDGDYTTGSGYFIYTEASSPQVAGDTAIIESGSFTIGQSELVSFWYHMYGAQMGTLAVDVFNGTSWVNEWSLSGDQGNSWQKVEVDLSTYGGTSIKLRFVGTVGSGFASDMALDDIQVRDVSGLLADSSGVLTLGKYTTNGGLLYTDGSGVVAQTAIGTTGQCLQSDAGGAPTWGVCDTAIAADSLGFTDLSDSLALDASTSIGLGANTLSTSGTGGITFGHTGDTSFAGKVGIGTATPSYALDVVGSITSTGLYTQDIAASGSITSTGLYTQDIAASVLLLSSGSGMFYTKVDYATYLGSQAVTISDLDNDGNADLATASSTTAGVLLNNGNGQFLPRSDYTTDGGSESITAGDLNNDGYADLVTANGFGNDVSVLINNGNGSFATTTAYSTNSQTHSVGIGDLDNDGNADLATANQGDVSVLINNGSGTFAADVVYATTCGNQSIIIDDLDGDGDKDLATASSGNCITVLLNNGSGTFATAVNYSAGNYPRSIASGDVDGDSDQDLVTANYFADTVSVFRNNGNGTFATKSDYTTGQEPLSVAMGDFNNDGWIDLATANQADSTTSILLNNGNGTFAVKDNYTTGSTPRSVAAGDLNNDNEIDLAIANYAGNSVSALVNRSEVLLQAQGALGVPFVITTSGNVGIGTASPSVPLEVAAVSGLDTIKVGRATGKANIKSTSNELVLESNTSWLGLNFYANQDIVLAYGGGNVGIGTTTPLRKLQVDTSAGASVQNDALLLRNTNTSSGAYVGLAFSHYNNDLDNQIKGGIGYVKTNTWSRGDIVFLNNSTASNSNINLSTDEVMRITNAGDVGIGDTSPDFKLDVKGVICQDTDANDTCDGTVTSDARLKTNVATIDNALDIVSALRGVTFEWRQDLYPSKFLGEGRQVGFIAQEVEEVLPELIMTDTNGYKAIDYQKITAVLANAINQQQLQIMAQKQDIQIIGDQLAAITASSSTLDMAVFGKLTAHGGLVVGGPAEFQGPAIFKAVAEFIDTVIFNKNVEFGGRASFNSDTGGFARIIQGQSSIKVEFENTYAELPIISASPVIHELNDEEWQRAMADDLCLPDIAREECQIVLSKKLLSAMPNYVVTAQSINSFTILLAEPAPQDITFSWSAIAVKDAKTATN